VWAEHAVHTLPAMNDFSESLDRVAAETGFSGVVRIDEEGATFARAYGKAHRGLGIPIDVDTQFAIASGGKTFTALAVIRLVVDGILSLDTTARSILGVDLPLIAEDVNVEHLLSHRSGIGDYLDEGGEEYDPHDYLMKSPVQVLDETEAFLVELDGYPTRFPAGERFSYCNGGFVVLALIAERASGVPYHRLVEERVIEPAGLVDTGFFRTDEPTGRMALGYLDETGLRTNIFHLPVRGNGDGGIYTTVGDLSRLWGAFYAGDIVPDDWVIEMTRSHAEAPEEGARYGFGFWLDDDGPGVKIIGGDTGASCYSRHDPTTGSIRTVLSNTVGGAWPIARHISQGDHQVEQ
jgi:CubicO group peptidase (beta-lactamase class C family)